MSELNCYDVQLLARAVGAMAEIEGMKAENQKQALESKEPKFLQPDFQNVIDCYYLGSGYLDGYIIHNR